MKLQHNTRKPRINSIVVLNWTNLWKTIREGEFETECLSIHKQFMNSPETVSSLRAFVNEVQREIQYTENS
jgi:hypothetical protein